MLSRPASHSRIIYYSRSMLDSDIRAAQGSRSRNLIPHSRRHERVLADGPASTCSTRAWFTQMLVKADRVRAQPAFQPLRARDSATRKCASSEWRESFARASSSAVAVTDRRAKAGFNDILDRIRILEEA